MTITADSLTTNETIPSRSRTFSPEVVKRVQDLLNGADGNQPARNIGIGTFDKEGAARSALVSLNKLLTENGATQTYASTVRATEDGKYKAVLLNKPAKERSEPKDKPAAKAK